MDVIDPAAIRKAAALVTALAELEDKFGVTLNRSGDIRFAIDGTTYTTGRGNDGRLGLQIGTTQ